MSDLLNPQSGPATAPAIAWPAIFGGAVVALASTVVCATLAAGFAAGAYSAWPNSGTGLTSFTAMTGVWLIITQWISSGLGGYLTGRLRTRWHDLDTHEVFFRDTANGFIAWALATVIVVGIGLIAAKASVDHTTVVATSDAASAAAKKTASGFAVFNAISMLVGAFIACVSAALGGQQRDDHP